jgi:hypothetical protein
MTDDKDLKSLEVARNQLIADFKKNNPELFEKMQKMLASQIFEDPEKEKEIISEESAKTK